MYYVEKVDIFTIIPKGLVLAKKHILSIRGQKIVLNM